MTADMSYMHLRHSIAHATNGSLHLDDALQAILLTIRWGDAAMLLTWLALASVGLAAGMLGAMLGLGGGLFLVPALTLLFGLPIRVAVGASLIGVIATSVGVASISRPGRSADVSLALRLEIAATLGALLGSLAAGLLSPRALSLLFAGVTFAAAAYTYLKTRRRIGPASEDAVEALFRRIIGRRTGRPASASWAWRVRCRD